MSGRGNVLGGAWLAGLVLMAAFAQAADQRLADAAEKRDREAVQSLLALTEQQADVNARQGDGATALHWAAHWNDLETAELLIRAGASANVANDYGVTPLLLACTNGSAPMAAILLRAGADPNGVLPTGETPLLKASRTGNVETVTLLLAAGADVNAREARQGQTALMWAAAQKHPPVVRALLEGGADVHANSNGGFSALFFSARLGDMESIRVLLAAGADVNAAALGDGGPGISTRYQNIGAIDAAKSSSEGMTPLLIASANGHEALSLFLLENGADPKAADPNGFTALHYAIQKGSVAHRSRATGLARRASLHVSAQHGGADRSASGARRGPKRAAHKAGAAGSLEHSPIQDSRRNTVSAGGRSLRRSADAPAGGARRGPAAGNG